MAGIWEEEGVDGSNRRRWFPICEGPTEVSVLKVSILKVLDLDVFHVC